MGQGMNIKQGERRDHWRMDGDKIDIFGMEYEHHNGPVCDSCGYSYCHHCESGLTEDCAKPIIEADCTNITDQETLPEPTTRNNELINPSTGETLIVTIGDVDITYACSIDWDNHSITLPANLPGGLEVCANGVVIYTSPIELKDRSAHVIADYKRRRLQPNALSTAIRMALIADGAAL
jgi:hypothetical protein